MSPLFQPRNKPKRVLVVDDEPDVLVLLPSILERPGVEFETARHGADAIRMAREKAPDLVILDLMMPGTSGWEVLQALRADPDTKDIPVLVLSAKQTLGDVERSLSLGANDYLHKPFENARLRKKVYGMLGLDETAAT